MGIKILRETGDYLVISKPAGICVHDGAGESHETVSDWLVKKYPEIKKLNWKTKNRIGIVHRLDKDTSGILILAKNPEVLDFFQNQFRNREVEKHYSCLVFGKSRHETGEITALIRRDPRDRERQKVEMLDFGMDEAERKASATRYRVLKAYDYKNIPLSLLDVQILTGRKHQIRSHMKFEGMPVMGDPKYFTKPSRRLSTRLGLPRQFLHAVKLRFLDYPLGKKIEIQDELPVEFEEILNKLDE